MALMVRMHDCDDRERFDSGTSYTLGTQGELHLFDDSKKPLATFAPGRWVGVFAVPSRAGEMRRIADEQVAKGLGDLADSLNRRA